MNFYTFPLIYLIYKSNQVYLHHDLVITHTINQ